MSLPATRPLTRSEIASVLQGVADAPEPVDIKAVAFWSTIAGLSQWCSVDDIDAVIADSTSHPFLQMPGLGTTGHVAHA